ncbi:MAG: ABC transporter permease [Chloroflexi bacterium]|nr:MAG: ABC transporter permease [Chloroflexota bacterium]
MKSILVARKYFVEMLREWQLLLLVVSTPIAFLVITAVGYSSPLLVTYPILVINPSENGAPLVAELEGQRYGNGRSIFQVTQISDPAQAQEILTDHGAAALVTLSAEDTAVTITGDALYPQFYRVGPLLENVVYDYVDQLAERPQMFQIVEEPIFNVGPETEFDLYAPGMILFGLMMIIPQTAMLVAREIRWGTLKRLRMTGLSAKDLFIGVTLSQLGIAVAQVVLVFVTAILMGFNNQGSLLLAILVGLVVSFSAIGLGLVVACFVENDGQAINVGSTVMMILVFFSGALYQMPSLTMFRLGGHQIGIFDVSPATHGFLALQQILTFGVGLQGIAFRLGMTLMLSLLVFAIGVFAFQRLKMQEQS